MARSSSILDDSAWPVAYARLEGPVDLAEFDRFARWQEQIADRALREGIRYVSVSDARLTEGLANAAQRKHMADFVSNLSDARTQAALVAIIIVDNVLALGVLRAIHWLSPPRSPTAVVKSLDEAWARVLRAFQDAGRPAPRKPDQWPSSSPSASPR
jgi:hypothetical protein